MIAQRFRSFAWLVGVAVFALFFYILSLQVATERGRLEEMDRKIAVSKREIRRLQTEIGTRASLRQLERWNSEALALGAPTAGQYLSGEHDVALIDARKLGNPMSVAPPAMASANRLPDDGAEADPRAVAMLGEVDAPVQEAIAGKATLGGVKEVKAIAAAAIPSVKPVSAVERP